jgi:hypothetical protein
VLYALGNLVGVVDERHCRVKVRDSMGRSIVVEVVCGRIFEVEGRGILVALCLVRRL